MNDKQLATIEQKTVDFKGDNLTAVRIENGEVYVPIRPVCELVGIDWSAQRKRIAGDLLLSDMAQGVAVTTTPSTDGRGGGEQQMLALPLSYFHGWLFGINAKRVKDDVRAPLLRYQRDCYRVLAEAFSPENSRFGRLRQLYRKIGRDDEWISARLKSIAFRNELTDEWEQRGVEGDEYALLTDEISQGAFALTTAEHKELKELEAGENLRDHMSTLELLVNSIGEATTTQLARQEDAQGFNENLSAAKRGGRAANVAREGIEAEIGKSVVTEKNFLPKQQQRPLIDLGDD